jgi:EAL domain-containing protein (putative c-di-GMP-specific phosphodiesterase class I)
MKSLKPDMIKLDRDCVSLLGKDAFMDAYVNAAVELADLLQIRTVAKGIEWKKQMDALEKKHLSMAQGFVFDKPLSADVFEEKYLV